MAMTETNQSPFFLSQISKIETPIWGLVPIREMTDEQIVQFMVELSEAMTALSVVGNFYVVYDLGKSMIEISSEMIE